MRSGSWQSRGACSERQVHRTELEGWYSKLKCSSRIQGKLALERVRANASWPQRKARAAQTRHLAEYVLHLVETFRGHGGEDNEMFMVCFTSRGSTTS